MKNRKKWPLGRSIAFGCILFTALLCVALSVFSYFNQKDALHTQYGSYISDLLRLVDAHIDDEDLKRCIETGEESQTYKETLRFMDGIMNAYGIHSLYAIKPLNLNETGNVMSVLSAEDDYNRYVDQKGNLYLGWISADEFKVETVQTFFDVMEQNEVLFFMEETAWGVDYTGAMPLRDAAGKAYAVLAVDVDATELKAELSSRVVKNIVVIAALGLLYTVLFLVWTKRNITQPIRQLEQGVVDYAARSRGQRDVEALRFEAPAIRPDNEVKSLSNAITQMTENMQGYVSEILSAEERTRSMRALADQMSELAVADTLTGVRNKNAYSREIKKLEQELEENRRLHFGLAMIDLNYLKRMNDTFGHEKGDEALWGVARLICASFAHSPVFRVGGDEFVVILRGYDYQHVEERRSRFLSQITVNPMDAPEPWKHISAAIGIALYDPETDSGVDDVLKRADQAMYQMKTEMKASREDHNPG